MSHAEISRRALAILESQVLVMHKLSYEPAPPASRWRKFWYAVTHFRGYPKFVPKRWDIPEGKKGDIVTIRLPGLPISKVEGDGNGR